MASAAPANAGVRALREHLEKDAPARELSVARFMLFATSATALIALSLTALIGPRLSVALAVLLSSLAVWYGGQWAALRRGWFNPWVSWANVAIEVSAPSLIFLIDARVRGAEYALTAPPLAIWGTLVGLSALRGSKPLSVLAGGLAGVEYFALYWFVARPALGADVWVTLQAPMIATRAFLLMCAGLITAAFVGHFNRRAEEALSAVRARDVLGKYLLHERIGAGGMAEVFRASYSPEGGFEKRVAVKRILPAYAEDASFVELFRQEAALCSRLNHPNVVQVMDFGRFGDTYFLAMEFIDGLSLKRVLDAHRHGLSIEAVTYLGHELLRALEYVHERAGDDGEPLHLVHRDVNPPNLLLSTAGEVKLADFGIARARSNVRLTQAGFIKGKPGYLAPEQLTDEAIDGQVDLFAVGITLHECLTGQPLFSNGSDARETFEVLEMPLSPPSKWRPEVPAAVDAVVMKLLERDRALRFATAREAAAAFTRLAPGVAPSAMGRKLLTLAVREATRSRERLQQEGVTVHVAP